MRTNRQPSAINSRLVHRDRLLAVKRGGIEWIEVDAWRKELHHDFERALAETKLPERLIMKRRPAF